MPARRVAERREELDRIGICGGLVFGMPLRPQGKTLRALDRHSLDHTVGRAGFDLKAGSELGDALAVEAVHHDLASAENAFEQSSRSDRDRMDGAIFHVEVVDLAR